MSKITYANKSALNPQPSIAEENKVTDANMNEIKSVVNGLVTDSYSTDDETAYSANYINSNSASYNNFESSDQVITSTEVQITGMSLTITTKKPKVLVMFTIPVKTSGDGSPFVRVFLDNVQKAQYTTNQAALMMMTHSIVLTDMTSGSHTISIKASKGNATSITIPAYITKSLTIIEL